MQIDVLRELTPAQWEQWQTFLSRAGTSHPEQDPRFAEVHRAEGKEVAYVLGWRDKALVAAGLFALTPHPFLPGRFSDAMAYSGPVCDALPDLLGFLAELGRTPLFRRVGRLRITPYWLGEAGEGLGPQLRDAGWAVFEAEDMRHTGRIDLRRSEEDIFQSYSKSVRDQIRKAQKLGLDVRPAASQEDASAFLASVNVHRNERGMGGLSARYMTAAFEGILRHNQLGTLLMIRHQDLLVGGILTYCGPRTAHALYMTTDAGALRQIGNLRIAPFLCHLSALWARSRGAEWLDLEGFKPGAEEGDKFYRIYRYKADLGVVHVTRVAGHALVVNPLLHWSGNAGGVLRKALRAAKAGLSRRLSAKRK